MPYTNSSSAYMHDRFMFQFSKVLFIEPHDSGSHMWQASTMMKFLDHFAIQLRRKRLELGLDATSRGLLICDKACVHHASIYKSARERWQRENNCLIVNGQTEDLVAIPGGFGAAGGPNDGWHAMWHALRRSWMRVAAGLGGNIKLRKAMEEMEMSMDGSARFSYGSQLWYWKRIAVRILYHTQIKMKQNKP